MLTDNFGRKFYYLRLSITDVCNFRCTYCLPDGYSCDHDRDFLSFDEIKRVANAFAQMGTEKIRITGGEPSLRKDLPEIIAACKQTPGIKKVAITTNGYKLPEHLQSWLDAGIDAINISIKNVKSSCNSSPGRAPNSFTIGSKSETLSRYFDKNITKIICHLSNGKCSHQ